MMMAMLVLQALGSKCSLTLPLKVVCPDNLGHCRTRRNQWGQVGGTSWHLSWRPTTGQPRRGVSLRRRLVGPRSAQVVDMAAGGTWRRWGFVAGTRWSGGWVAAQLRAGGGLWGAHLCHAVASKLSALSRLGGAGFDSPRHLGRQVGFLACLRHPQTAL